MWDKAPQWQNVSIRRADPGTDKGADVTETFVPEIILDRESPVPLYEQIAAPIEHAIRTLSLIHI